VSKMQFLSFYQTCSMINMLLNLTYMSHLEPRWYRDPVWDCLTRVTRIIISYGQFIDFLSITFNNGKVVSAGRRVGLQYVDLKFDDDYVIRIDVERDWILNSISFTTKKRGLVYLVGGGGGGNKITYKGAGKEAHLVDVTLSDQVYQNKLVVADIIPCWSNY